MYFSVPNAINHIFVGATRTNTVDPPVFKYTRSQTIIDSTTCGCWDNNQPDNNPMTDSVIGVAISANKKLRDLSSTFTSGTFMPIALCEKVTS